MSLCFVIEKAAARAASDGPGRLRAPGDVPQRPALCWPSGFRLRSRRLARPSLLRSTAVTGCRRRWTRAELVSGAVGAARAGAGRAGTAASAPRSRDSRGRATPQWRKRAGRPAAGGGSSTVIGNAT
ncbi:MAG: hypothetical protein MZV64_70870 [Ignavibacteriales bacterium]|nr:hypothetical protein [Ignavibacteriales bacterium]